ncbi:MAG: RluA family pseudouridine synthase [Planctomycetes bacterium]|nr:RluA family pseudouridine synthase [Planctomycetota bacterium]
MIPLLHDDEALVAASKPEGLATVPGRDDPRDCLRVQLEQQLGARLLAVHRLDKPVSGVVVLARTPQALRELSRQFERRLARKTYLALVDGVVATDEGGSDAPLREFGSGRTAVDPAGRACRTRWRVLLRLPAATLLEVVPHTGRRHQIRAHLYAAGHAVLGDLLYGERARQAASPRLMLHAARLELAHPSSGEPLVLSAPPPESFDAVLRAQQG